MKLCSLNPSVEAGHIEFLGLVAGVPVFKEVNRGTRYIIPRFVGSEDNSLSYYGCPHWCGWFVNPNISFRGHFIRDPFPPETEEAILSFIRLHHKLSS